jgi:hypothetical protein
MGRKRAPGPRYCDKPDRDVPKIKCGYPLPCPWHTAILDPAAGTVTIPEHAPARTVAGLRRITKALKK